ncbi:MAG: aminopeptidase N [Pseudomonadota bacterium]
MNDRKNGTIFLANYTPFPFRIDHVDLAFHLHPTATRVRGKLTITPLAEAEDLDLFGEALTLRHGPLINGDEVIFEPLNPRLPPFAEGIRIDWASIPKDTFELEMEVEIAPQSNTALEGLYMSKGMYCTQCEAEGFRKIMYYPDRPDVMAPFTVRVDGSHPVLLSNGNLVGQGDGWAEWHDPWPKPAYLFALVAGDLAAFSDRITTMEGRDVALNIWVRPGDEDRCAYAMDALKRSFIWDEEVYGRAYDLDVFNIVAVDDFNMGAMENKGLNIFNSKYVLASPETATDRDYELIEGIIAHEYFHNWTGNRITCRDWFQLCLKEGLTVFRDQQFSADMRSPAVRRIEDVLTLRARQFREDAGPLAHNVRPESYIEINNFYTATVYEKGAEIIAMLRRLVGASGYRAALDLYFDRHDGQACTIEDWLRVFEDATGRDLAQFKRWYSQAGTPRLTAHLDQSGTALRLILRQETRPTPGQPDKEPVVIPVSYGLLAPDGTELLPTQLAVLDGPELVLEHDLSALSDAAGIAVPDRVVPALLRGFSAPVILEHEASRADRLVLLANDPDPFTRWEAGRSLAKDVVSATVLEGDTPDPTWLEALGTVLADDGLEPAFRALVLALPSEDDMADSLARSGAVPDPTAIHWVLEETKDAIAEALGSQLAQLFEAMAVPGRYTPEADAAGRRSLRMAALSLLSRGDDGRRARELFAAQTNMTEEFAAFLCLLRAGDADAARTFEARWRHDALVMDKWFFACIAQTPPDQAVARATALTEHPDFDLTTPNRFRAVMGGLTAGNPAGFHDTSGAGYRFIADWLLRLDPKNPQTAARMSTAFETWARYDADRQDLIQTELTRIAGAPHLSRDLAEMVARMRAAPAD